MSPAPSISQNERFLTGLLRLGHVAVGRVMNRWKPGESCHGKMEMHQVPVRGIVRARELSRYHGRVLMARFVIICATGSCLD